MTTDPLRFPYRDELNMPVIGLEAEFQVFVDEREVVPEEIWRTPAAFIDRPMLRRTSKSSQLPTGGAVYFDGGVIEVVTPVIEIAPQCTARVVRSLWEQIGFVRDHLDRWEAKTNRRVRLAGFSLHVNISFELGRDERNRNRTIQKLAMLLAHVLAVPVIVTGANRKSTGVGVRPRRDRIEMTLDFIPDPGLMAAATAMMVGIVRDVISWDSYLVTELARRGLPMLEGVTPGKHPTRNGWVTKDFHFPRNPYTARLDAKNWRLLGGGGSKTSLRELALMTALHFRESIQRVADPFSVRVLFSMLRGETPALLDLPARPAAYDDVGRATRWGSVLPELANFTTAMHDEVTKAEPSRRAADLEMRLNPPWTGELLDRRERVTLPARVERRAGDRHRERRSEPPPKPSPRLSRSEYEKVFLKLASGKRLKVGNELLTPIAVKGWYHSVFVTRKGEERLLSIDQLLEIGEWTV
jgi:hypothetical protein